MGIESISACDRTFASVQQKGESPFSGQALSFDLQTAQRFTALLEEGHALTKEALNVCERRLAQSESPRQAFEPLLQSSALKMILPMEQQPALEQTSAELESVSRHVPTTSVAPFAVESAVVKEAVTETPTRVPQCAEPPTTPHTTGFVLLAPQTASAPSKTAPYIADESTKAPLVTSPDLVVKPAPSPLKAPVATPSQPILKTAVAFEQPKIVEQGSVRPIALQGGSHRPEMTVEPLMQSELPKVAPQGIAATLPHGVEAQPNLRQPEGTAAVVSLAMPILQTVMTKQATVASVDERPVVAEPVISQSQVLPSAPQAIRTDLPREVAPQGGANPPAITVELVVQPELPKIAPQGVAAAVPHGVEAQSIWRQPEGTAAVVSPAMPVSQTVTTKQEAVASVGERPVASPLTPEHEVASKVVYFRGRDVEGLLRETVQVIASTMLPITLPHQQVETIAQPIASHEVVQHFVMAAQAVADALLVSSGFVRGEGQLLVRLRPEVLGGSEIRLVATEGTLTVIVNPATQDVQTLVEANRTQFEQYLAEKVTSWRLAVTVKRGGNDDERL